MKHVLLQTLERAIWQSLALFHERWPLCAMLVFITKHNHTSPHRETVKSTKQISTQNNRKISLKCGPPMIIIFYSFSFMEPLVNHTEIGRYLFPTRSFLHRPTSVGECLLPLIIMYIFKNRRSINIIRVSWHCFRAITWPISTNSCRLLMTITSNWRWFHSVTSSIGESIAWYFFIAALWL